MNDDQLRALAATRPGYATYPDSRGGSPSWWTRHGQQPPQRPEPDPITFEKALTDPHGQFDPDNELLPHLLDFGPPKDGQEAAELPTNPPQILATGFITLAEPPASRWRQWLGRWRTRRHAKPAQQTKES